MKKLNILVGCEKSGAVRDALRKLGHNAVSCDLLPSDTPGPHYQGNLLDLVYLNRDGGTYRMQGRAAEFCRINRIYHWDMAIFFPPCTFISIVGMRWNVGNPARQRKTKLALTFVKKLWNAPIPKIAIENPRGVIPKHLGIKATQEIQPFMFGHAISKRQCLWLKNLPPLKPTKVVLLPDDYNYKSKSGKTISKWYSDLPKDKRAMLRGITFKGVATAMAKQWTK